MKATRHHFQNDSLPLRNEGKFCHHRHKMLLIILRAAGKADEDIIDRNSNPLHCHFVKYAMMVFAFLSLTFRVCLLEVTALIGLCLSFCHAART